MIFSYFIKGLLLGLYVAAPFGVVSLLYVKRTIQHGKKSGIASALAVTTTEAFYAAVAIFGLSVISELILNWKDVMKSCGALFMLYVGIRTFFVDPYKKTRLSEKQSLTADYVSMLGLSAFNPIAVVGFLTVFTTFDVAIFQNNFQAVIMWIGATLASFCYCLTIIFIADFLSKKFHTKDREIVAILHQMSGVVIVVFTIAIFVFSILKN